MKVNKPGRMPKTRFPCALRRGAGRHRRLSGTVASANWHVLLLFAAVLCAPRAAPAADLLDVYRDAASYDAQYIAARAARDAGREQLPQGRALLLPSLTLSGGVSRTKLDAHLDPPAVPSVDKRDFHTDSYELTLVQPLYHKENNVQYSEAGYRVRQTDAAYAQAHQDLILRVSQAYFGVLTAQDALTFIRAQEAAIAEQLARAKRRFQVGAATITDTREAQARYDLAAAQEIAARNDVDVAKRVLEQVAGKTYDHVQPLRPHVALAPLQSQSLKRWVELGRRHSYPVMEKEAQVHIQRLEIARNRAGHYPTLDFVASYAGVDQTGTVLTPIGSRATTASVGVQFNLPLYAGGAVSSRTREAAAELDKARADLDSARRQQALAVERDFLNVISGTNRVRALEQALASSESALASNKLGYEVGVRINIDVLNAEQQVYSTQRQLSAARYRTILDQLQLKAAVGSLGEADVEEVNHALAPPAGDAH